MDDNSSDRLTLARRFLEPANSTHRQYEALRAFFVDGLPSAEAAARFGYTHQQSPNIGTPVLGARQRYPPAI